MKIAVLGASGPQGRRGTQAARTQRRNLRPEPGWAGGGRVPLHGSGRTTQSYRGGISLEAAMRDHGDAAVDC